MIKIYKYYKVEVMISYMGAAMPFLSELRVTCEVEEGCLASESRGCTLLL